MVLSAACLWGTIGTSYSVILDDVDTDLLAVVTIRAVTATALLWGWLALRDRAALRIAAAHVPALATFGLVKVTVFYPALIFAFDRTGVAVGTLLLYLAPAIVTLGAVVFLGERLTRRRVGALTATTVGCVLVVGAYRPGSMATDLGGVAWGLLAAVSYACYSLGGKPLLARHGVATVLAYHLALGSGGLVLVKLAVSPESWPDWQGVLIIGGYNGVVTTLAPIALYTLGLRGLPAGEASILSTLEPVVALVLAAAVLEERLATGQWLGALCVVAGVAALAVGGSGRRLPALGRGATARRRARSTTYPVRGAEPADKSA